ncbi:hypothetical protein G7075_19990 [Phycicoccus sp. HDW14]|uniref:hypothetical protein n=1 Tax=Phycicoccus sp. HDW14 TaxID=2714941 RepID=UPI00140AD9B8|nr:hypothetical protein [Phycicoccus sp. HDW14]QIM22877.1 hypothetical protein G7075_19990 [Phycicoccus sp. HDW14]
MSKTSADPRITKRKVTMRRFRVVAPEVPGGPPGVREDVAEDYVNPEFVDEYVAAARARGWDDVAVSDEPDAGPGGYHGQTAVPAGINHPEAGTVRPATQED